MALPVLLLSRFEGGLNTNDRPTELLPSEAQVLTHLFVDQMGRMVFAGGQHKVVPNQAGVVRGLIRYASPDIVRLLFIQGESLIAYDETYQAATTLLSSIGSTTGNVEFTGLYERAFFTDGSGRPWVWYGSTTPSRAGIVPPGTAATGSADGAGNLDSSGTDDYTWYVVFKNAAGIRSNPSPVSLSVPLNNQKALITNIPVSTDPQVTSREIYRAGGYAGPIPRLVGAVANNTGTTFSDNVADTALSLTQIETANDVPPDGAKIVYSHSNRLFITGVDATPNRVWYSTYGQPEYFPESTVGEDTDLVGGSFDVPPRANNAIVGLSSTGSVLVIGRQRSIDILLGDSVSNFRVRQVADVGVASHRAMARCDNVVVFLGGDAMVYMLEDDGAKPIAKKIEKTLLAVDGYWLRFACAAYVGQRYILCIPRGIGFTPLVLAFDFRTGAWTELSAYSMAASAMIADLAATTRGELLLATDTSYLDVDGNAFSGIVSALTLSDATKAQIAWKSPDFEMGLPVRVKRVKSILVEGTLVLADSDEPVICTIETTLPGGSSGEITVSRSYKIERTSGRLLDTTTHADLCGQKVTISISGAITSGNISRVQIEYAVVA